MPTTSLVPIVKAKCYFWHRGHVRDFHLWLTQRCRALRENRRVHCQAGKLGTPMDGSFRPLVSHPVGALATRISPLIMSTPPALWSLRLGFSRFLSTCAFLEDVRLSMYLHVSFCRFVFVCISLKEWETKMASTILFPGFSGKRLIVSFNHLVKDSPRPSNHDLLVFSSNKIQSVKRPIDLSLI